MSKSPGLYYDIGEKARDVLYKDYGQEQKMYQFKYKECSWSFDLSCKIQDVVPGLNAVVGLVVPQSGKVELQYRGDYFGLSGGIGLKVEELNLNPELNFSGIVGNRLFRFGSIVTFNVARQSFDKFNSGLTFDTGLFLASLTMHKLNSLRASCYYTVNPLKNTAIAAEMNFIFLTKETSLSIGATRALFESTVLKGKIETNGKVGALVQQELWGRLFVTVGGDVDFMSQRKVPNIGVSIALKIKNMIDK